MRNIHAFFLFSSPFMKRMIVVRNAIIAFYCLSIYTMLLSWVEKFWLRQISLNNIIVASLLSFYCMNISYHYMSPHQSHQHNPLNYHKPTRLVHTARHCDRETHCLDSENSQLEIHVKRKFLIMLRRKKGCKK